MADDMEEAAQAFDTVISNEKASPKPTEKMFPNLGVAEVDEESPAKGGGDDEDLLYADQSDKGKPEEGEDEDEPKEGDEDESEGDEEEEDESVGQSYKVMVDGEEKEVSLKEALEGYIRTETFHKRMTEIAETNKIVQRAATDVVQNF